MKQFNCPDCNDYIYSCEGCIRYVTSDKYVTNMETNKENEYLKNLYDKLETTAPGIFTLRKFPMQPSDAYYNESCRYCSNNPINGGSGICHCILGQPKIT